MIVENRKVKKYQFNNDDTIKIIDFLKTYNNFKNVHEMDSEHIETLIDKIEFFLDNIKEIEVVEKVRIHETQEEAKEYFGDEFVKQFDKICDDLLKEKNWLYIHGTAENETSKKILKTGFIYRGNIIGGTACALPQIDNKVNYEELLNWPHYEHKSLVIIVIPKEAREKGFWEEHGNDYIITKDFIYGYIDVNNKKIILNDNYSKTHDYTNKVVDSNMRWFGSKITNVNENKNYYNETIKTKKEEEINSTTMLIKLMNLIYTLLHKFSSIRGIKDSCIYDNELTEIKEYLNELKAIYNFYLEEELNYFI